MSKTYFGDGWVDIDGYPLAPGQRVIVSRPAGNNSSRLSRVIIQGFTRLGVRVEIADKNSLGKWDVPVFNVPYRKDKFYVIGKDILIQRPVVP